MAMSKAVTDKIILLIFALFSMSAGIWMWKMHFTHTPTTEADFLTVEGTLAKTEVAKGKFAHRDFWIEGEPTIYRAGSAHYRSNFRSDEFSEDDARGQPVEFSVLRPDSGLPGSETATGEAIQVYSVTVGGEPYLTVEDYLKWENSSYQYMPWAAVFICIFSAVCWIALIRAQWMRAGADPAGS